MNDSIEYRLWVTIPDLGLDDETHWQPLIDWLEIRAPSFGPVISWSGPDSLLTLTVGADSASQAARRGVAVVVEALDSVGLDRHYPTGLEVEPIEREFVDA